MESSAFPHWIPAGLVCLACLALAAPATADLDLGPEHIVQFFGIDLEVFGYSVPTFIDWNEDGLCDLVVGEGGGGEGSGKVRVYPNEGSPTSPVFGIFHYVQADDRDLVVPSGGCMGCFPRVVHWDGDGRKDLLVGTYDGSVLLFLNVASDTEPAFAPGVPLEVGEPGFATPITVVSRATPMVVDWNADGRKDLVCGAADGKIRVFLNEGTDTEPVFLVETCATTGTEDLVVPSGRASPIVCHLDDDGCKDLLCGNTVGQLVRFTNTGTDTDPVFGAGWEPITADGTVIDLEGDARSRPSICDWTGDGLLDVLVGSGDGLVRLYQGVEPVSEAPDRIATSPLRLLPPWPNPANPRVTVAFTLEREAAVRLAIWDVRGRLVRELTAGRQDSGRHVCVWDGADDAGRAAPSGIYLARLAGADAVQVQKVVLAR